MNALEVDGMDWGSFLIGFAAYWVIRLAVLVYRESWVCHQCGKVFDCNHYA